MVGDDDKLITKLLRAIRLLEPKFLALIGSPVPTVIGTDLKAICRIVEKKTGIPCLSFPTTGLKNYVSGEEMTYHSLVKRFVENDDIQKNTCQVNLIGATPIDMWEPTSVDEMIRILKEAGAETISCWGIGGTLEEIAGAAASSLNIVVSYAGLKMARLLQEKYGTPYLAWWPCGSKEEERFIEAVRAVLTHEKWKEEPVQGKDGLRALIISEQISGNAVRRCLQEERGVGEAVVASFFGMDPELMQECDQSLDSEQDLVDLVEKSKPFDLVIADEEYRALLPYEPRQYVAIPHMAVSGVLHYKEAFDLVGRHADGYWSMVLS